MDNNAEIETQNVDELFLQVRTAHRLLAAYYQRLLPTVEQIASNNGTNFWFWYTCRFSKTARNPFSNWKWDMLPASIPSYVFKSIDSFESVKKGDLILEFIVINDSGIRDEPRRPEPDALNMQVNVNEAKSLLKINIYKAYRDQSGKFEAVWDQVAYPKVNDSYQCSLDDSFVTTAFEVPLSELLTEDGVNRINERITTSIRKAEEFQLASVEEENKARKMGL
ncbi:hypothetical protein [Vibrio rumoiensis]|uniref:Uncharacterized protein n=1 Tax=Vibrio rumoiensis TaxID=76258 RepID=A0ABW7J0J5_9VIBR